MTGGLPLRDVKENLSWGRMWPGRNSLTIEGPKAPNKLKSLVNGESIVVNMTCSNCFSFWNVSFFFVKLDYIGIERGKRGDAVHATGNIVLWACIAHSYLRVMIMCVDTIWLLW